MPDRHSIQQLIDQAQAERRAERFADARRRLDTALAHARRLGDRSLFARALNDLARVHRDLGDVEAAIARYRELNELFVEDGDVLGEAHARRHLGDLHAGRGQLTEAETHYARALECLEAARADGLERANALRSLALLKVEQGDGGHALQCWRQARDLYHRAEVEAGVAECDEWVARLERASRS